MPYLGNILRWEAGKLFNQYGQSATIPVIDDSYLGHMVFHNSDVTLAYAMVYAGLEPDEFYLAFIQTRKTNIKLYLRLNADDLMKQLNKGYEFMGYEKQLTS